MTNLESILKSSDITLLTKVHLVKAVFFPVVMNEFEQTPEDSEGQGSLLWGSPWNLKELDMTTHPVHPKGNQS